MIDAPGKKTIDSAGPAGSAWDTSARMLLAALWLILPCVQYVGAVQRTPPLPQAEAPPPLAAIDLTPWYVLLVGATVIYAILRLIGRRPHSA